MRKYRGIKEAAPKTQRKYRPQYSLHESEEHFSEILASSKRIQKIIYDMQANESMAVWKNIQQNVKIIFLWDYLFFFLHFYVSSQLFTRAKYSFLIKDTSNMEKKVYRTIF